MSKAEAKLGIRGQELAANVLRQIGVFMVEHIGTPFTIVKAGRRGWYQGFFGEKVSGDLRGHTKNGISVLAEVKTIWNRNLRWSDLREHQPGRLDMHAERAISLLIWVHDSGVFIMLWPVPGFRPGKSISPEQAASLNIADIMDVRVVG